MDDTVNIEVSADIDIKTEDEGIYPNYEDDDATNFIKVEPEYSEYEHGDFQVDYSFLECKLEEGDRVKRKYTKKKDKAIKRKNEEDAECGACSKTFTVGSLEYITHCKEEHHLEKVDAIGWMVEEHLKNQRQNNSGHILCCTTCLKHCLTVEDVKICAASHLNESPKELICKVPNCKMKKPFKTRKTYLNHLRSAHNMISKGKERMTYTCAACFEQFSSQFTLKRHRDRFHKDFLPPSPYPYPRGGLNNQNSLSFLQRGEMDSSSSDLKVPDIPSDDLSCMVAENDMVAQNGELVPHEPHLDLISMGAEVDMVVQNGELEPHEPNLDVLGFPG